ncbi:hypothetical protein [Cohnella pontilimi]|uniref:hypothetical protein n=1 Tax=Cohnella pontilimi TaxID=2564100 RepID=UPI00145EDE35|nr:hypothetical protein [Cohnella pontilimi]
MVDRTDAEQPTIAPGVDEAQTLEAEPTEKERKRGDYTEVTTLHLDRTPED